jgi:glycosyltransferase involved in cell wall biosynthesis
VAASLAPDDLAAAIRRVLDVEPGVAAERRRRIASIARERFNWPLVAGRYRALVESITRPGSDSIDP